MAFRHPALDLTVAVTTPENISFEYQLAGPFRRLPAMILDIVIRYVVVLMVGMVFICSGVAAVLPGSGTLFTVSMFIGIFLLSWFYGLVFEVWWNGQTPGKRALNLRVVSVDGRPINGAQATIRNFVRVADFFPYASSQILVPESNLYIFPTMLVGLGCMLMTRRFQRLGDLAAGTMVVVDERGWRAKKIALSDPRIRSLAEFIPAGFRMSRSMAQTIALYMERRPQMSSARQQQVAMFLAGPLIQQFDFRPDTSSDLVLCALYYREFYQDDVKQKIDRDRTYGSPIMTAPTTSDVAEEPAVTISNHVSDEALS